MAQKLDDIVSMMCWCIALLEDKHITSNAVDHSLVAVPASATLLDSTAC